MNFNALLKMVESSFEDSNSFYTAVGEYVGANVPLNIEKWSTQLSPYIKQNVQCYRMWQVDNSKFKLLQQDETYKMDIPKASYYACSKDVESIKAMMADDGGFQNVVISKHTGPAIDILALLKDAIKNTQNLELKKYLTNVYRANAHQNESLLLGERYLDYALTPLSSANIVAMCESGDPDELQ